MMAEQKRPLAAGQRLSLGHRLRQERERRHWPQEHLVSALGEHVVLVSVSSINRWEHDRATPRPYYRNLLCRVFNLSHDTLFGVIEGYVFELSGQVQQRRQRMWTVPYLRNRYFTGCNEVLDRQMALDAYEGEQRLNHTASNREHVWRLLQGGELLTPVPPLPPGETEPSATGSSGSATCEPEVNNRSLPESNSAPLPETEKPVVKKTKPRKKVEAKLPEQEVSRVILASDPTPKVAPKPARERRKKTAEPAQDAPFAEGASNGSGSSTTTDSEMVAASAKPKRTRRVGEPKPKRHPVGEQEAEQGL